MITDSYKSYALIAGQWVRLETACGYWLLERVNRGMHWYALGYTKAGRDHYE